MRTPLSPLRSTQPDPRLDRALRRLVFAGLVLVLALPVARGNSAWFGALPLWLLVMPLLSWWALHRFPLPRMTSPALVRRRRTTAQARRRRVSQSPARVRRAA